MHSVVVRIESSARGITDFDAASSRRVRAKRSIGGELDAPSLSWGDDVGAHDLLLCHATHRPKSPSMKPRCPLRTSPTSLPGAVPRSLTT